MKSPESLKEINGEWLIDWAKDDAEKTKWLKEQVEANTLEIKGVKRPSIPKIRVEWAKKYKPELIPEKKAKTKKPSLYDRIMNL